MMSPISFSYDGVHLDSARYAPGELVAMYEHGSGRKVDPGTLRFYRVLSACKSVAIMCASSVKAVLHGHSHQDVLHTCWVSASEVNWLNF